MHSLVEDVAVQPRRRSSAVVGLAVAPEVVVVVHGVHVEAGGGAGHRVAGEHARHAAAAGAGPGVVVGGAVQPGVGGGLVLS